MKKKLDVSEVGMLDPHIIEDDTNKDTPKVVYMPAEISFDKLRKLENTLKAIALFESKIN